MKTTRTYVRSSWSEASRVEFKVEFEFKRSVKCALV